MSNSSCGGIGGRSPNAKWRGISRLAGPATGRVFRRETGHGPRAGGLNGRVRTDRDYRLSFGCVVAAVGAATGFVTGAAAFQDLLSDFLGSGFDLLHLFAHA